MFELVSYIMRSSIKAKILELLEKPQTPTQIAKKLDIHRSSVSRSILNLEEKDLVKCLTPDERMCRLYQITGKGKKVLEEVKKSF